MIALLPVYRPSFHLPQLLTALGNDAPAVVVDDGGGPGAAAVLDAARALGATVLRHPVNRGKGAAVRTGLAHIAEAWPGRGVVCADADGPLDDNAASHFSPLGDSARVYRPLLAGLFGADAREG
ncbi:glycosyltransferase [Dactylosporangium sp. NPDC000244]|uniref:glycosyltransferase n=1 Tax=Dactylosporangium sp. NPDC000244 TaxID=3154365 RepID=UPI00331D0E15